MATLRGTSGEGGLDYTGFAAAVFRHCVPLLEGIRRQSEPVIKYLEKGVVDFDGFPHERCDRFGHVGVHSGWIRPASLLWIGQGIVFGYVDKFWSVRLARRVHSISSGGFVSTKRSIEPRSSQAFPRTQKSCQHPLVRI
jgi:hypothetical protein